jgi:hypothetical protein
VHAFSCATTQVFFFGEVAANPLLLSLTVLIFKHGMVHLPRDLHSLYDAAIERSVREQVRVLRKANDPAAAEEPIVLRLAALAAEADPATLLIEALVEIAIWSMRTKRSEFTSEDVWSALQDKPSHWKVWLTCLQSSTGVPLVKTLVAAKREEKLATDGSMNTRCRGVLAEQSLAEQVCGPVGSLPLRSMPLSTRVRPRFNASPC